MTQRVALALSPHLDDAVFSCGGTLARLVREGWTVVVATLFTRSVPDPSGFALACQLDKGLGAEIDYMALRRDEDAAATAALGCSPEWLAFAEAPHRGYASAAALFGETRSDDDVVPSLGAAIAGLLAKHRPALVLAPQAIGGHVDHVQAVRGLDEAGSAPTIAWWVDFPYAVRDERPAQPFAGRFLRLDAREIVLAPSDRAAKRAACLCYASQLGFQFGGPEGLTRRLDEAGAAEHFRGAAIP